MNGELLMDCIKKSYKVMSRSSCEKYCSKHHELSSVIISISSTWDKIKPNIYSNENNSVKAILPLSFDDIDLEENREHCMSLDDGRKVSFFIDEWYNKVDIIIVHCDAGISRSAGVAAAIMRVKEGSDGKIIYSSSKKPNMTCYLRTLKGFNYI